MTHPPAERLDALTGAAIYWGESLAAGRRRPETIDLLDALNTHAGLAGRTLAAAGIDPGSRVEDGMTSEVYGWIDARPAVSPGRIQDTPVGHPHDQPGPPTGS